MLIRKLCIWFLFLIPFLGFSEEQEKQNIPQDLPSSKKCKEYQPRFTGPFLAESASNISKGQTCPSLTFYYMQNYAGYDNNWHSSKMPDTIMYMYEASLQWGMTTWLDITFDSSLSRSTYQQYDSNHWRDTTIKLGFQLLKENRSTAAPAIRFTFKESLPTGKFQHLNFYKNYIDGTGTGSYMTILGFDVSKVFSVFKCHWLKLVGNIHYAIPANVKVSSPNVYTGLFDSSGTVNPGKTFSTFFSFDYSFTKHFAFSTDFFFMYISKTRFKGTRVLGIIPIGTISSLAAAIPISPPPPHLIIAQVDARAAIFTISPAIEWNFSENLGINATYWFSVAGKNLANFRSVGASISYTF